MKTHVVSALAAAVALATVACASAMNRPGSVAVTDSPAELSDSSTATQKLAWSAQAVFLFKHEGRDYLLNIFQPRSELGASDARSLHNDPSIRRALDTSFYFDG